MKISVISVAFSISEIRYEVVRREQFPSHLVELDSREDFDPLGEHLLYIGGETRVQPGAVCRRPPPKLGGGRVAHPRPPARAVRPRLPIALFVELADLEKGKSMFSTKVLFKVQTHT